MFLPNILNSFVRFKVRSPASTFTFEEKFWRQVFTWRFRKIFIFSGIILRILGARLDTVIVQKCLVCIFTFIYFPLTYHIYEKQKTLSWFRGKYHFLHNKFLELDIVNFFYTDLPFWSNVSKFWLFYLDRLFLWLSCKSY